MLHIFLMWLNLKPAVICPEACVGGELDFGGHANAFSDSSSLLRGRHVKHVFRLLLTAF